MALLYPDKLKSSNPNAYGIIDAKEISGHRVVRNAFDLYTLPLSILKSGEDSAVGQVWCAGNCLYMLIDESKHDNAEGWKKIYDIDNREQQYSIVQLSEIIVNTVILNGTLIDSTAEIVYDKILGRICFKNNGEYYQNWIKEDGILEKGTNKPLSNVIYIVNNETETNIYIYKSNLHRLVQLNEQSTNVETITTTELESILV